MSKDHSTAPAKPSKPYPDFPLFPHATRRWAKKIKGKLYYFGPWSDPDAALKKYLAQKDDLRAGRKPRTDPEALTIKDLVNAFLNHKKNLLDTGELSPRMWLDYKATTDLLIDHLGKGRQAGDVRPDDFASLRNKMAKKWGPVTLGNVIQRVRSVFKYGFDAELLDKPVRFGPGFARPSKKTLRLEKARKGPKLFSREEILVLLLTAPVHLEAMILLGVNCGFGNHDCATLPLSAVDLASGWVNYHRPKTGINRRCPLWPETVAALKEALARRPEPKHEASGGLLFITKYGQSWGKDIPDNPISKEMRKLLDNLGISGNRSFYALRHCFETIGGEAKDQAAVDHIMGHTREDMATIYREKIGDDRLRAVADHVRAWLFGRQSA